MMLTPLGPAPILGSVCLMPSPGEGLPMGMPSFLSVMRSQSPTRCAGCRENSYPRGSLSCELHHKLGKSFRILPPRAAISHVLR